MLIWRHDVGELQIHIETKLCTLTLEIRTLKSNQRCLFQLDLNKMIQRRNNVIFNVEFHEVWQRRSKFVNMTVCKRNKKGNLQLKIK